MHEADSAMARDLQVGNILINLGQVRRGIIVPSLQTSQLAALLAC